MLQMTRDTIQVPASFRRGLLQRCVLAALCGVPVVAAAASADASDEQASVLATVTVEAAAQPQQALVGKSEQDLREIPQSVTVISRERMEKQALKTLDDVMLQATGVTREQLWLNNNYTSRGLKIENIRYDGGSASSMQDRSNNADMAQYESVALLRGADGLFGAGEAGGVINLVSKRPQAERRDSLTLSAGSWNNYRVETDLTGALNADKSIRGRAVTVFHDQDLFHEPSHNRRGMVYGALEFDLAPQTVLFTGASYQKDKLDAFNASLPRWEDGKDIGFSRSTTMGAPWGWIDRESLSAFAILQHQINADWKAQVNLRQNIGNDAINGAEMEGSVKYATGENQWWRYQDSTDFKETSLDLNLQGSFELAGRRHDLIWGVDAVSNKNDYRQNWTYYGDGNVFNRVAPPEWAYPDHDWESNAVTRNRRAASYASLRLRPVDKLAFIFGGRYTFDDITRINNRVKGAADTYRQDDKAVPYYGVVYDLTPRTMVYASYAEIYKSQGNYLASPTGPSLEPLTGSNIELGIKSSIADNVTASLALYKIRKEKEAVYLSWNALPSSPGMCCYAAVGDLRSEGVDLELTGRVTADWDLSLGYTFNDNENRRDTGMPFSTVTPKHLFKAWTNHKLGALVPGLEVGGGVTVQSKHYKNGWVREFNPATSQYDGPWTQIEIVQKPYAVWSARAGYDLGPNWNVSLNVNNVFDKTYYSTVGYPGYGNFYGEPRNVMLTLKASY